MTYLDNGDQVLVPNPGYPSYTAAVKLAGADPVYYELNEAQNYKPDFNELEQFMLTGQVKMMFVNYPHMPTGQLPGRNLFDELVRFAERHSILIVHDNPYSFILNEEPMSLLSIKGSKEVVIELNSLSKSHNMAGWRVGVLCGAAQRVEEVLRFKSNMDSGMFLPVQLAAARALSLDKDWYDGLNAVYYKRRIKAFEMLEMLGCNFSKNQAGLFVWTKIPSRYEDGYAMSNDVLERSNVFITPGGIFGSAGEKYVRVSLCICEERIGEAIERIRQAFDN